MSADRQFRPNLLDQTLIWLSGVALPIALPVTTAIAISAQEEPAKIVVALHAFLPEETGREVRDICLAAGESRSLKVALRHGAEPHVTLGARRVRTEELDRAQPARHPARLVGSQLSLRHRERRDAIFGIPHDGARADRIVPIFAPLFADEPVPVEGLIEVDERPGFGVGLNPALKWNRPFTPR